MMTLIFKLEMSNSEAETLNKSKIHVDIVLLFLKKGLNIILNISINRLTNNFIHLNICICQDKVDYISVTNKPQDLSGLI